MFSIKGFHGVNCSKGKASTTLILMSNWTSKRSPIALHQESAFFTGIGIRLGWNFSIGVGIRVTVAIQNFKRVCEDLIFRQIIHINDRRQTFKRVDIGCRFILLVHLFNSLFVEFGFYCSLILLKPGFHILSFLGVVHLAIAVFFVKPLFLLEIVDILASLSIFLDQGIVQRTKLFFTHIQKLIFFLSVGLFGFHIVAVDFGFVVSEHNPPVKLFFLRLISLRVFGLELAESESDKVRDLGWELFKEGLGCHKGGQCANEQHFHFYNTKQQYH